MILGIDPGVKGGAAWLDYEGRVVSILPFAGLSEQEIALGFIYATVTRCFMEKVGYIGKRPGREKGDGGKGSFTFGRSYGFYRGLIMAQGIEILDVPPAFWQSKMGCLTGGDKNVSERKAQELFPQIKVTHGIADALLIAEYGRRMLQTQEPTRSYT